MREEVVSQGIVLKVIPYKDNDAILSVYFREYGKLSLLASGLRKPKSKNVSACQPFMISEFTFFLKKGLCKLISARLINGNHHIAENLSYQATATLICEYFYRGILDNQPSVEHYEFLFHSLKCLNEGYHYLQVYLFAIAFILKDSGSAIIVDCCAMCDDTHQIAGIDIKSGGFVCIKHHQDNTKYSVDFLKMFRLINHASIKQIDYLTTNVFELKELKKIMDQFYDEYCGIQLKSKQFI